MLKVVALVAFVGLVAAANGPSAAWTKNAGIACNNRNELPTQKGITIETAKAYCESESTCVSFEANPTLGKGRFQFSTSCTVSVADRTDMHGWSLFVIARKTPTASQRANLKLADAHYVTNTKASIAAAEPLYKQSVVEFGALFGAGSLLTKSAKKRYNYLLDHDSRKPAAEQALVGKIPYAASELFSRLNGTSHDQCSDGVQNGDETGVDCGGSCAACPTCSDGVQNQAETGVDCGGTCTACVQACPIDVLQAACDQAAALAGQRIEPNLPCCNTCDKGDTYWIGLKIAHDSCGASKWYCNKAGCRCGAIRQRTGSCSCDISC